MNMLNDTLDKLNLDKYQTELQEKQKHEYKHLGSFWVNKSLKLYSYSFLTGKIEEVEIERKRNIYAVVENGKLVAKDLDFEKAVVDSRLVFFESLNMKNAIKRVHNFKSGKIKELCNLREVGQTKINFFK